MSRLDSLDFEETLRALQGLIDRHVVVGVYKPGPDENGTKWAAVLAGYLRRGASGDSLLPLDDDDVAFVVGRFGHGSATCFVLSPETFIDATWDDVEGKLLLTVSSTHALYMINPDEHASDEIG